MAVEMRTMRKVVIWFTKTQSEWFNLEYDKISLLLYTILLT